MQIKAHGIGIEVEDSGPGLDDAARERAFDRFYRGENARARTSGTGMGLWIARGFLAAQHGRVWADNAAGGGAVFSIAVPSTDDVTSADDDRGMAD